MLRFTIRKLLVLTLLVAMVVAFSIGSPHLDFIALFMSNDDVVLTSSGDGIETSGATAIVALFGSSARETLLRKLDDSDSFAAAHVALTEIVSPYSDHQMEIQIDENDQCCNQMAYSLNADRELRFDFSVQPPLERWWREYLPRKDRRDKLIVCSGVLHVGELDFSEFDDDN